MADGFAHDPIPSGRSFQIANFAFGRFPYRVHAHGCFELMHIARGFCSALVGDRRELAVGGDLFLLAPRVPHSFYHDGFMPNGETCESNLLFARPESLDEARTPELASAAPMLARARRGLRFRGPVVAEAARILADLRRAGPDAEGIGRLYLLIARLAADSSAETLAGHEVSQRFIGEELARLEAIQGLIHQRYREELGPEEVAAEIGIAPTTLHQLLRKYTKKSFLNTLTEARLAEAKRLLRESDDEVIAIALAAGFGSLATFNRRFRGSENRSPQEYRLAHR